MRPWLFTLLSLAGVVTGGVWLLLPSLNGGPEPADKVKCASNLRQIGLAMRQYTELDPSGLYPPDDVTLERQTDLTPANFSCPLSEMQLRDDGPPLQLSQNVDYAYLAQPTDAVEEAPATVHGYCRRHLRLGNGTNVLYADARVRFELSPVLP